MSMSVDRPVHLCIPTLNRYDLLLGCLWSAINGSYPPACVWLINNGRHLAAMHKLEIQLGRVVPLVVYTPEENLGCAASWNWFLRHVPEERLIVNDDVTFAPESIQRMIETPGPIVSGLGGSAFFSCFLIRDDCARRVGEFDESISPGYCYYEDNDYAFRMAQWNVPQISVECGVSHGLSQTLKEYSPEAMQAHHQKFQLARENFRKKWGRLPGEPVVSAPRRTFVMEE